MKTYAIHIINTINEKKHMVCLMDTEKVFVHIQLVGRQLNKRGPEGNILLLRVSPETHGGDQTEQCTVGVRPGEWR